MRTYYLKADNTGTQWNLGLYGETPFYPSGRSFVKLTDYNDVGEGNFSPNGDNYQQNTFTGTILFKGQLIDQDHTAEAKYRAFMKFIGENTTSKAIVKSSYIFETLSTNKTKTLRLYSENVDGTGFTKRWCYVSIYSINNLQKSGQDLVGTLTFKLLSYWNVSHQTELATITNQGSVSQMSYFRISFASYGDIGEILVGLKDASHPRIASSASTADTIGLYDLNDHELTINLPINRNLQTNVTTNGIVTFAEVYGNYRMVGKNTMVSSQGSLTVTYPSGYNLMSSNSVSKIKCGVGEVVSLYSTRNTTGYLVWEEKFFTD